MTEAVRCADADMAELADAPDLGSGGRPCRFKSCYPHKIRVLKPLFLYTRTESEDFP